MGQHIIDLGQQGGQAHARFGAGQQDVRVKGQQVRCIALIVHHQLGDALAIQAAQYLIGDGQLLGSLVVTGVGHLYDNVRIGGFFQRALERFHQVVGQAADEADRIHQNNLQAAGQGQLAGGGVQRGEQHVRLKNLLAAQGVQQAGLAHVGVAHQCHHGHIVFLAGAAGLTPALLHLF